MITYICHNIRSWFSFIRVPRYTPATFMMTSSNGNIFHVTDHLCGRGLHRSLVNSPHKGQRRGALMFSLICVWINGWENNREAGDLRRHHAHYDVIVMLQGALMMQFNVSWYHTQHCNDRGWTIFWTHKRHPIPRPYRRAMGHLFVRFWRKLTT